MLTALINFREKLDKMAECLNEIQKILKFMK